MDREEHEARIVARAIAWSHANTNFDRVMSAYTDGSDDSAVPKTLHDATYDRWADAMEKLFVAADEYVAEYPDAHVVGISTAATRLGHKGGKKGGLARAKALTPERRSEIARNAVNTRWRNVSRAG